MAFRFGLPVGLVKLCATGPLFGYVQFPSPSLISTVVDNRPSAAFSWPLVARDTEHRAMMLLAGACDQTAPGHLAKLTAANPTSGLRARANLLRYCDALGSHPR
jgi:hypothetical protein